MVGGDWGLKDSGVAVDLLHCRLEMSPRSAPARTFNLHIMSNPGALNQEWITLQNNFEQYEWMGLALKVFGVTVALLGVLLQLSLVVVCAVLLLVWLQEAILRTFQNRLGRRLLHLEALMAATSPESNLGVEADAQGVHKLAFQLHTQWQTLRPRGLNLVLEYAASAVRPTVAFPHVVIVAALVLMAFV